MKTIPIRRDRTLLCPACRLQPRGTRHPLCRVPEVHESEARWRSTATAYRYTANRYTEVET